MWIALGIVAFLAVVITVILSLPVYVIIKNSDEGELMLRYRFLFRTFGEHPDPNNPIVLLLKSATGLDKISVDVLKGKVKTGGVSVTVEETARILLSLLGELRGILKYCVAKKLYIDVICTADDPADAATNFGLCSAFVYPVAGFLKSELGRVSKRGESITVRCDFEGTEDTFDYHLVIRVRVFRLLAALWRIILREARAQAEDQSSQ